MLSLIKLLNELINKDDINVRITNLLNELLETSKLIENCISCEKYNIKETDFDELINKIELEKEEQEKKKIINKLDDKLIDIDDKLNKQVLCVGCKEKKIENLIDKCGNEEMARLIYQSKLNSDDSEYYIRWIPFNEFGNIEYLAKGGFGEVSKATWFGRYEYSYYEYKEIDVVLKRIYNSSNNILDILKEVNKNKV